MPCDGIEPVTLSGNEVTLPKPVTPAVACIWHETNPGALPNASFNVTVPAVSPMLLTVIVQVTFSP